MAEQETVVYVRVQAGAKRNQICGFRNEELKLRIKQPAEKGKANKALIRFLSKILGISRSNIILEHGDRSSAKRVRVKGMGYREVLSMLDV